MAVDVPSQRWPGSKIAQVAFLLGQGFNASAIADKLNDDTSAGMIRQMKRIWGLTSAQARRGTTPLTINLSQATRSDLESQAEALGIPPAEFIRRVSICVVRDNMYAAVTDGEFE